MDLGGHTYIECPLLVVPVFHLTHCQADQEETPAEHKSRSSSSTQRQDSRTSFMLGQTSADSTETPGSGGARTSECYHSTEDLSSLNTAHTLYTLTIHLQVTTRIILVSI